MPLLALAVCASVACDSESRTELDPELDSGRGARGPADAGSPRPTCCAREGADAIRSAFCSESAPEIDSLQTLMEQLRISPDPLAVLPEEPPADGFLVPRAISVLGHSTALAGRVVSPINPRAIVLGPRTIMAYQRGVQRIELATLADGRGTFTFYLVSFTQACNERPDGCRPGDLYTERVERDWTGVEIHDDEDLKNTPMDCRQCHQRGRDTATLLMRELVAPWTHFFDFPGDRNRGPGVRGGDLVDDYLLAKGDEPYAGISRETISRTSGFALEAVVSRAQPLLFDVLAIESERFPDGPDGPPDEPLPSPTWEAAYAAFKRGEQLALPYLEVRATDPDKQARLSDAYARYRAGEISADELPDLADIFPDDPQVRARIGLQTEPDATPAAALIQACTPCHNDVLDQSLSRARFSVDLARLDRAQLDLAIARIELRPGAAGAMPPPEARQLDPGARPRLLEFLRADSRPAEVDAELKRAAELGMRGSEL